MQYTKALRVTTSTEREVVITRAFEAPRSLVFKAWTECEHLKRWMLGPEGWTMPICEIDLRPGGASRLGWRRADGTEMEIRRQYREIVPPERLVATESWGDDWPETLNTLVLTEEDGRTITMLTLLYASKEARDAALQPEQRTGWNTDTGDSTTTFKRWSDDRVFG